MICLRICSQVTLSIDDMKILSESHKKSLATSNKKDYVSSVSYFEDKKTSNVIISLMKLSDESELIDGLHNNQIYEYKDSISMWLGDYGYYLYKTKDFEKCIIITSYVILTGPKFSWAFLVKADALYDSGRIIESKPVYIEFINLMKEKGYENVIPSRIYERIK